LVAGAFRRHKCALAVEAVEEVNGCPARASRTPRCLRLERVFE
jgi:hypothetical protein